MSALSISINIIEVRLLGVINATLSRAMIASLNEAVLRHGPRALVQLIKA